jgi:hypothetical protein
MPPSAPPQSLPLFDFEFQQTAPGAGLELELWEHAVEPLPGYSLRSAFDKARGSVVGSQSTIAKGSTATETERQPRDPSDAAASQNGPAGC